MKKSIFTLMISAIVALTSCNKSDTTPTDSRSADQFVTFRVDVPTTRNAVTGLTRYIVEAYQDNDLTKSPMRAESATGELTIALYKDTPYTFLFWADYGTAKTSNTPSDGYWNTADLRAVSVSEAMKGEVGQAAYCHVAEFSSTNFEDNKNVTLKNATAQLNFVEGIGMETATNILTVIYPSSNKFNVATSEVEVIEGVVTHTFTGITQAALGETFASDYILAPAGEKDILNIKLSFNLGVEREINNVPFEKNYKTNIKGGYNNAYSSVFTISNEVEDYINNPDVEAAPVK